MSPSLIWRKDASNSSLKSSIVSIMNYLHCSFPVKSTCNAQCFAIMLLYLSYGLPNQNKYSTFISVMTTIAGLDNCETPGKCELNYGKLTRAKENTGEPPVLRRQVQL